MSCRPSLVAFAFLGAAALAGGRARAQISSSSSSSSGGTTMNSGTENIVAGVANPERFLYQNGVCRGCAATDVTETPRSQNLNPEGVNYTDCEQDLRMDFTLVLSGFNGGDSASVQVWAGTVDCTQDTNRVTTAGTLHACWQIAGSYGPVLATTSQTITTSVYARDVLRYSAPPTTSTSAQSFDPTFNYSSSGESACHIQSSDAAVPISIYFVPVNSTSNALGTAYQYALTTDLVAPPPPTVSPVQSGDTLLTVNWSSPGTDPDIVGFSVFSDPPAGGSTTGGCSCGGAAGSGANSYVGDGALPIQDSSPAGSRCMEAEVDAAQCDADVCIADDGPVESTINDSAAADVELEAAGLEGGPLEASTPDGGGPEAGGAGDAGARDGGKGLPVNCNPINMGGAIDGGASSCADLLLTANQFIVNGGTTMMTADGSIVEVEAAPPPPVFDLEAGGDAGGVTLSGGGISEIPPAYNAGEIDSVTATSLTLTGLKNGKIYHVVVTTIDGSGNVGPVSTMVCAIPAPVNDFWKTYQVDGGRARGCALEGGPNTQAGSVLGLGVFAAIAALLRRRKR